TWDTESRRNRVLDGYPTSRTPPPIAARREGSSARTPRAGTLSRPPSRRLRPWLPMEFGTGGMTSLPTEPVAALTAATGFGFLVGLTLAIGSRADAGGRTWLPELNSRRHIL